MLRRRSGFTLIELLIVIVIIGILAAIALPKLEKTRERAMFRALMSDLRHLHTRQEMYFNHPGNGYTYTTDINLLSDYRLSNGVTIDIYEATNQGFAATAIHSGMIATKQCGVYFGTVSAVPSFVTAPGMVLCTGD